MGYKSTRRISRKRAMQLLLSEIVMVDNDTLSRLLDVLADSRQSENISSCDNFDISDSYSDNEEDNG